VEQGDAPGLWLQILGVLFCICHFDELHALIGRYLSAEDAHVHRMCVVSVAAEDALQDLNGVFFLLRANVRWSLGGQLARIIGTVGTWRTIARCSVKDQNHFADVVHIEQKDAFASPLIAAQNFLSATSQSAGAARHVKPVILVHAQVLMQKVIDTLLQTAIGASDN
jgi:hypothetical protein